MKVSRKSTNPVLLNSDQDEEMLLGAPQPKLEECGRNIQENESTNRYRNETYEKDGWTINKSFSEGRNFYNGQLNVYIGRSLRKEKDGQSEWLDNNYNLNEGVVTVTTNRGSSKTYNECDMSVDDWQFSMDLED